MYVPFNKPFIVGDEIRYIKDAVDSGHLSGDGLYTKQCCSWIESNINVKKALLVHSCTAALEMAALLCDIKPGDEVIVPSYTFVSTVNAFVLRGAVPVYVDIRPDTLNMDETKIEELITEKTRVIVPVHYAGVACDMDKIMQVAEKYNLVVVEDAAQAVLSEYKGKKLGSIGHIGCFSFHETKNFISGEGGALLINDEKYISRAEIIKDKGTNRCKFFRGEVDKYTWVDLGSSYLASELTASFLFGQLEKVDVITEQRQKIWNSYYNGLKVLEELGHLTLPVIPSDCVQNYHMFYILVNNSKIQQELLAYLKKHDIKAVFHYIPLHSSPMGKTLLKENIDLPNTDDYSSRLIRLPFFFELTETEQNYIINSINSFFLK